MQMNHLVALKFLDEYLLYFQKVVMKEWNAELLAVVVVAAVVIVIEYVEFVTVVVDDDLENSLLLLVVVVVVVVVDVHNNIQQMHLLLVRRLPLPVLMHLIRMMQIVSMGMYVPNGFHEIVH